MDLPASVAATVLFPGIAGLLSIFVVSLCLEVMARKNPGFFRPSIWLAAIANWCKDTFFSLGAHLSRICSFLYFFWTLVLQFTAWLELPEIGQAAWDILTPLGQLIISPCHLFRGYVVTINNMASGQELTYLGSGLLLLVVLIGIIELFFRDVPV